MIMTGHTSCVITINNVCGDTNNGHRGKCLTTKEGKIG